MDNVNKILSQIEVLDSITKSLMPIDVLIRYGQIVSAYRQTVQVLKDVELDQSKEGFYFLVKTLSKSLVKMRKGEQIDALNDIKSLSDSVKNERKKKIDKLKEYLSQKIS